MVLPGINIMLPKCFREIMIPGKVTFSAEIQIIMFLIIQHAINDLDGSHPDRSRGKSGVHIRIIRGIDLQVTIQYTAYREISQHEFQCRASI